MITNTEPQRDNSRYSGNIPKFIGLIVTTLRRKDLFSRSTPEETRKTLWEAFLPPIPRYAPTWLVWVDATLFLLRTISLRLRTLMHFLDRQWLIWKAKKSKRKQERQWNGIFRLGSDRDHSGLCCCAFSFPCSSVGTSRVRLVERGVAWFRGLKGRDIPAQGNALGIIGYKDCWAL